jgi:nitrate reductase gamma subunit
MTGVLVVFFYGSILFCVIASAHRLMRFIRAPLHLRWEIYQGSSVYETSDWWAKPPPRLARKFASAFLDILFLRDFYRRNRSLWYFLYPFHLGIYLIILWHAWLFIAALALNAETATFWGLVWGHGATGLAFFGGTGILIKRLSEEDLRIYYPPIHYLKWIFLLLTLLGGFYAVHFHFNASMPELFRYMKIQLAFENFEHKLHPAPATAAHVLFASVWLIYLPFSHVFQLFFRYYHMLRWDDVPNLRGSLIERKVKKNLDQPIGWSAFHIPSGKKWGEAVSDIKGSTITDQR